MSGKDQQGASHDDLSMQSATDDSLASGGPHFHARQMFVVSEEKAVAIRDAFDRGGEFAVGVELRRRFPGIGDNEQARRCARKGHLRRRGRIDLEYASVGGAAAADEYEGMILSR
jgi:hypothetical protein